jgi:Ca-activated chloride channel family protein
MRKLCLAVGGVLLAWSPTLPVAQSTGGQGAQAGQFRARSDVVEVYATAIGRNGAGVHDLRGDEFELFEDGKRQEITVFSTMVQPLSVALVLDHSGSTDNEFTQVLQASGEFIGRLFKEDRASMSTLGWDCAPFTNDRGTLVDALQKKLPRDPGSPIWSATDRAMASLGAESGRRVIVLLSDGADNQEEVLGAPPHPPSAREIAAAATAVCKKADISVLRTLKDVMERAERETVMVYVVQVPGMDPSGGVAFGAASGGIGPTSPNPPLLERDPRANLAKLAKRSGGSVHELSDYAQLKAAFKVIADELHLQYLLGFAPKADGKRHDITVRVKRPGVTIRARESYRAESR